MSQSKKNEASEILNRSSGQVSVFLATSLIIIISLIAFVVNIGLLVKAKINLQNAVDAAAWSGAAVQARQMSKIGYLNWEMRNNYKEWMFKYYVLGNHVVLNTNSHNKVPNQIDFTMPSNITGTDKDRFNIPSVCIDVNPSDTICDKYNVPGLPRFDDTQFPGPGQITRRFLDSMAAEKARQCSNRTLRNFLTLAAWTYGVPDPTTEEINIPGVPQLAMDNGRMGAFPKALELSIRIRNLEKMINATPRSSGVCAATGNAAGSCSESIRTLSSDAINNPQNERVTKAFYSAYRNLGNEFDSEMKQSFTLTELAPRSIDPSRIDQNSFYPYSDSAKYTKHYFDLIAQTVNFAPLYTAFFSYSSESDTGAQVSEDAGCGVTKVALPVPGYPFGFYKNPEVLTYYAVKGEANFEGLFNPFGTSIKLTAYAAAKPFGSRIGPAIFKKSGDGIRARNASGQSAPYITSMNLDGVKGITSGPDKANIIESDDFKLGAPLPLRDFWITREEQIIGGPQLGGNPFYAIPNLAYDLNNGNSGGSISFEIMKKGIDDGVDSSKLVFGLYHQNQMNSFRSFLNGRITLDPPLVAAALDRINAPTDYETINYLIPTPEDIHGQKDSIAPIFSTKDSNDNYFWRTFAPLIHPNSEVSPYKSITELVAGLEEFIQNQEPSVNKYLESLRKAADAIMSSQSGVADSELNYTSAANKIYTVAGGTTVSADQLNCQSLAGQFRAFYLGSASVADSTNCPEAFKEGLKNYWDSKSGGVESIENFYSTRNYQLPTTATDPNRKNLDPEKIFNSFTPSPRNNLRHPYLSREIATRRNFYSTKFVPISSLYPSQIYSNQSNFAIFSEGQKRNPEGIPDSSPSFLNPLSPVEIDVKH